MRDDLAVFRCLGWTESHVFLAIVVGLTKIVQNLIVILLIVKLHEHIFQVELIIGIDLLRMPAVLPQARRYHDQHSSSLSKNHSILFDILSIFQFFGFTDPPGDIDNFDKYGIEPLHDLVCF